MNLFDSKHRIPRPFAVLSLLLCLLASASFASAAPPSLGKLGGEAKAAIAAGDYPQAIALLQKIIAQDPGNPDWKMDLADLYRRTQRYEEALSWYDQVLARAPAHQDALMGKAYIARIQGNWAGGRKIAEGVLKSNPKNTDAAIFLADLDRREKRYRESKKLYQEVLKQQPANAEALAGIRQLDQIDQEVGHQERNVLGPLSTPSKRWQLEAGAGAQEFNYYSTAPSVYAQAIYKRPQKYYLLGRFDYLNKYGDQAYQFTVGGGYYVHPRIILNDSISASTANFVAPEFQNAFEIDGILPKGFVPYLRYIYRHYNVVDVQILRPGFAWYYSTWAILDLSYNLSINDFDTIPGTPLDSSFAAKFTFIPLVDRLSFFAYYARTEESFDPGNSLQSGRFHANLVGGGVEWFAFQNVGFRFSTEYENRDNGQTLHSYNAALLYRF